jgi:hypothetical protein
VDDDRSASVAEERVGVGAESYVFVLDLRIGFALGIDGEVFHVAGVMTFGIIEAMLLAFGIEMRTGGFEIRRIAFWILVEVNGVLAGGKAVKMQLEGDGCSLLPHENGAYVLALGIFEFDFGFGGAGKRGGNQDSDEEEPWMFHAGNYSECGGGLHFRAMLDPQGCGVYCGKVWNPFRKVQSWVWMRWSR